MLTVFRRSYVCHLNNLALLQRRATSFGNTSCSKRKRKLVAEISVPAHSALFFAISIDDHFHVDTLLTSIVFFHACHSASFLNLQLSLVGRPVLFICHTDCFG